MALFAALVGLAAGGGLAARLFVGGAIGLSDQGDGTRLLCSLGLREGNPYNTPMTDYVYLTWYSHQWFGEACGALGSGEPYNSSQLWFLSVAKWLTPILQLPGGLDLRALGLVFCVVVAVLMAALAALLPGTGVARLAGVAGVMLVVADGTFAGYFLSAYSEPAALVGLLGLVVSILLFWRARRASWWSLLLVVGTCLLTITAKTQSASLLVTVIPLILLRPSFGSAVSSRLAQRRHVGARVRLHNRAAAFVVSRWPALGCALLMLVVTGQYLGSQPHRFEEQNRYAAVFIEMLPHSPDPAQDLQRLGLDPAMVSSSGTPINAPGSAASTLGFVDFVQHTSPLDTTLIYLEQPWRLVGMGDRGVSGMAILRADYIFSYPPSAGHPPNTAECRVCVLQSAWKWVFGAFPPFITLVTVVCVAVCWRRVWTRRRDARQAGLAVVGAFLGLSAMAQFWVVMLTEGASDLIKHMVLANFMTALLIVVTFYGTVVRPRRSTADQDALGEPARTSPDSDTGIGPVTGPRSVSHSP